MHCFIYLIAMLILPGLISRKDAGETGSCMDLRTVRGWYYVGLGVKRIRRQIPKSMKK